MTDLLSAHGPLSPPLPPSLQTAPPEGFGERIYNLLFSTMNEGLPPAKTWVGPDAGLPPAPPVTLGKLAMLGTLGFGGMGAAVPEIAAGVPALLQAAPLASLRSMATGLVGSEIGSRVGEYVGGDPGRDIGTALGGLVQVPRIRAPKADIVGVEPTGPLEGTAVLTREGLAKPMFHGTPAEYQEMDITRTNPEGLFGPGHYFTSAPQNVAEGYSRYGSIKKLEKELRDRQQIADKAYARFRGVERQVIEALPERHRDQLLMSDNLPVEAKGLADLYRTYGLPETANLIEKYPGLMTRSDQLSDKLSRLSDKLDEIRSNYSTPNIRPAYLNIRNPFDIDKPVSTDNTRTLARALEQLKQRTKDPDFAEELDPLIEDLHYSANMTGRLKSPQPDAAIPGERLYNKLSEILGKPGTNKLLEGVGFDGITHIGGGRFTGGPHKPMKHRVHIAFRDDQVVPYFSPQFSEEQATREAAKKARKKP